MNTEAFANPNSCDVYCFNHWPPPCVLDGIRPCSDIIWEFTHDYLASELYPHQSYVHMEAKYGLSTTYPPHLWKAGYHCAKTA